MTLLPARVGLVDRPGRDSQKVTGRPMDSPTNLAPSKVAHKGKETNTELVNACEAMSYSCGSGQGPGQLPCHGDPVSSRPGWRQRGGLAFVESWEEGAGGVGAAAA